MLNLIDMFCCGLMQNEDIIQPVDKQNDKAAVVV